MEECKISLESFQNNKSPGNDGIPVEFYKNCWNLICNPFFDCVNASFEKRNCSTPESRLLLHLLLFITR